MIDNVYLTIQHEVHFDLFSFYTIPKILLSGILSAEYHVRVVISYRCISGTISFLKSFHSFNLKEPALCGRQCW